MSVATLAVRDKEDTPSQVTVQDQVVEAVDQLGGAATAADVAAAAGVSMEAAKVALTRLTATLAGDPATAIEVDEEGEIRYQFPRKLESALRRRSRWARARGVWKKVKPGLRTVGKSLFGMSLVANVVIVATLLQSLSDSQNNNGESGGRVRRSSSMMALDFTFDMLWWNDRDRYWRSRLTGEPMEMNFLESVYSYVFGDGDPNLGLSEEQLRLAAACIRDSGGAVTAEQLAIFFDPPDPNSLTGSGNGAIVDESWMIPALVAFSGTAEVTDDGDIVYVFPELMNTAIGTSSSSTKGTPGETDEETAQRALWRALAAEPPGTESKNAITTGSAGELVEQELEFSAAPMSNLVVAGALGAVNLLGAVYLGQVLNAANARGVSILPGVQRLHAVLLAYALAFNAIPLWRWANLRRENEAIASRNDKRRTWALRMLRSSEGAGRRSTLNAGNEADETLERKLKGARLFSSRGPKRIGTDTSIVYSTADSKEEMDQLESERALQAFDAQIEASSSSSASSSSLNTSEGGESAKTS